MLCHFFWCRIFCRILSSNQINLEINMRDKCVYHIWFSFERDKTIFQMHQSRLFFFFFFPLESWIGINISAIILFKIKMITMTPQSTIQTPYMMDAGYDKNSRPSKIIPESTHQPLLCSLAFHSWHKHSICWFFSF